MTYQYDPILGQGRDGVVSLTEQQKGFDAGSAAAKAAFQASVSGYDRRWNVPRVLRKPQAQMLNPPTAVTSTVSSGIVGGRTFSFYTADDASFPFVGASALTAATPAAGAQVVGPVTINSAGTVKQNQTMRYLMEFDGTQISFSNRSAGGAYWIKINDEYIEPAGVTLAADAVQRWFTLTFSQRTQCRIEFVSYYLPLLSVTVDSTAALFPAPIRGPRMIMLGDSFTAGASSYSRVIADMLGWDDVWGSGSGGTGLVANNGGAGKTFGQRFATDVLAYSPQILWVVGSVNDDGQSPAEVAAALLDLRNQFISSRPGGLFVWTDNASNGPSAWAINKNIKRAACKSALAGLTNTYVADILESKVYTYNLAPSSTVRTAITVGLSTINLYGQQVNGGWPQAGSVIKIDDETLEVKSGSFAGSDGRWHFSVVIDGATKATHAAGAVWTQVGASYITGSGSAGTPSGYGSSDRYRTSTNDIHPTFEGQVAMGKAMASVLSGVLPQS